MEQVLEQAARLTGREEPDALLTQCAAEAVGEILAWCGLEALPTGCIPIAARRAASRYEGADVKAVKRGDFSVTYNGGEEGFYRSLLPYRKVRF